MGSVALEDVALVFVQAPGGEDLVFRGDAGGPGGGGQLDRRPGRIVGLGLDEKDRTGELFDRRQHGLAQTGQRKRLVLDAANRVVVPPKLLPITPT